MFCQSNDDFFYEGVFMTFFRNLSLKIYFIRRFQMRKKNWLGILVMVLVLGITVVGCDDGSKGGADTTLNGTWSRESYSITISGNSWTWLYNGTNFSKGTMSYDNSTFTLNRTHVWSNGGWVSTNNNTTTGNYSLSENTLTITNCNEVMMNGAWVKQQ
jgi:hypothetical protein